MSSQFEFDKTAVLIRLAESSEGLPVQGDEALNNLVYAVRLIIGKKRNAMKEKISHHASMMEACGYVKGKKVPNGLQWALNEIHELVDELSKMEEQATILADAMARDAPDLLAACKAAREAKPRSHLCCSGLDKASNHASAQFEAYVEAVDRTNKSTATAESKVSAQTQSGAKKRKQKN